MRYLNIVNDQRNPLYKNNNPIVVLCFDNNYCFPAINTMNSINRYNKEICFICVCSFLTNDNLKKLLSIKDFGVRCLQMEWSHNVDTRFYSIDVAFNVYLPWILRDIDKCLYVDPDVICMKNIMSIFDTDATIAMSLELSGMINNLATRLPNGSSTDVLYYNTGTLFLNLNKIRCKYCEEDIDNQFIDKIDEYYLLDQDFINSFFKNDISTLPFTWNVQWYEFNGGWFYNKLINEAYFLHFSFHKPWRHTSPFKQSRLYLKLSTNDETIRMVKKARIKRFCLLVKNIFLFPLKIVSRLIND